MTKALKSKLLFSAMVFAIALESSAQEPKNRFLQIEGESNTVTYDLSTVQMITPGRFTIVETTLDNPDIMRFKLRLHAGLRTYCLNSEGQYLASADLLTLGPADMPIETVVVSTHKAGKVVQWRYPYKRLRQGFEILRCSDSDTEYREVITNGVTMKRLFDCKRGLHGVLIGTEDPMKAITGLVPKGSIAFEHYSLACTSVMQQAPYVPD